MVTTRYDVLHEKPTVRAFIIDDARKLLLIKRGRGFEEGKWCVPGGKLNHFFENEYEAIKREVMEEVGLQFTPVLFGVGYEEDGIKFAYPTLYFGGALEGVPHVDGVEAVDFRLSTLEDVLISHDLAFNKGKSLKDVCKAILSLELTPLLISSGHNMGTDGSNVYK